ncbi:MAG TPA: enolase C-terminal domain-like protein [Burkholderiaceae bacterium]|nr:enolase C-terminal domain-like protein [Burkholderiaceae bacterium]
MNPITVTRLDVRMANPPLAVPHATASGMVASFPVVLLDLRTSAGITGSAYAFVYTMLAAPAVARLLADLSAVVVGQPCAPLALDALLRQRFRLPGAQGLVAMARAAIDMAAWDVVCKANGLPLYAQLGATRRGARGYGPVGLSGREGSARESRAGVARGFRGVKAKIGYASVAEDIAVLRAMREAVGPDVAIMADYNQALDVAEAMARCAALDADPVIDLAWIEEPTTAEDYAGHAQIKAATRIPIQAGENWWGPLEVRKALNAGAVDLMMPDAMKVGGVTSWMKVAAMAEVDGMPISNHLFPEVSAHLMAAAPTAGWFEWCDWAEPILAAPVEVRDGLVWPSDKPGIGVEWNEAAVARFEVK